MADAFDFELVQRVSHHLDCRRPVRPPGTQLGDHRIVIHRDLATLEHAGVVAHDFGCTRVFGWRAIPRQPPDRRQEVSVRVFGIKPAFHRPAVDLHILLADRQLLAVGHPDHLLDQIDAGNQFCHRVFHLEARVHLKEIEIPVSIDDELNRPGAAIIHRFRQGHGLLTHRLAGCGVKKRRRRLFDDLLVPPLDRAFAFIQVNAVAMLVAQNLNLDMARLGDEFFDEDPVIAKARRCLVLRRLKALARLCVVPGDPHALAAAARRRLDHHRIADLVRDLHRLVGIRDQAHIARHRRNPGLGRQFLRGDLVTHRLDRTGRRADEGDTGLVQRLGKLHVFRQETITRMHRLGAGFLDCRHDLVDHDIRLVRRGRADMHRLVRHLDMQRISVGVGIDRDRLDPHLFRRLDHPAGDFATVRDQDFLEHLVVPFMPRWLRSSLSIGFGWIGARR